MSGSVAATQTVFDETDGKVGPPGAIAYPADMSGMWFLCPCGCGRHGWLPFRSHTSGHPSWEFDGNAEAPTLTPSVLQVGGCQWHGYLRAGVWESV